MAANLNIMSIYDLNNNVLVNPSTSTRNTLTLTGQANTSVIIIRWQLFNAAPELDTIKVSFSNFGSVKNTKSIVRAIQSTTFIIETSVEFSYTTNVGAKKEIDINWSLTGQYVTGGTSSSDLYFSTMNDNKFTLPISQPASGIVEQCQFNNIVDGNIGQNLSSLGYDGGGIPLCDIECKYAENDNIWLEFEGDQSLANSFKYYTQVIEQGGVIKRYFIYITSYSANLTNARKSLKIYICCKSSVTGNVVRYTDNSTILNKAQPMTSSNIDIKFNVPSLTFIYKGGVISGNIQYTTSITSNVNVTVPSWLQYVQKSTKTTEGITTIVFDLICSRNISTNNRSDLIEITSTMNGGTRTNYVRVEQWPEPNMTYAGTFQDMFVNFNVDENIGSFKICDDETDEVIYKGIAYPINGVCNININDIINNYINTGIQFLYKPNVSLNSGIGKFFYDNNSCRVFYVKVGEDIIQTFHVVYNWSFENDFVDKLISNENKVWLNRPLQRVVDYRQYIYASKFWFNDDYDDATTIKFPIEKSHVSYEAYITAAYDKIMNISFKVPYFDEDKEKEITKMEIVYNDDIKHQFKICYNNHYTHCLYYINKYGGVDWYLFNAVTKENRSIINSQAKTNDNRLNYNRVITSSWTLKTELLSDEQSKLMPNMLESTCMYLHDLNTNEIFKVNLTDTSYDCKTFRNNNRKLYNYTLKVESSSDRVIKA